MKLPGRFEKTKKQWKRREKEDKLIGIGQIGEGFVRKLCWANKATTYHLAKLALQVYKAREKDEKIEWVYIN